MQGQIQQMKSSIANIQQHLLKLECEETNKIDQVQQNILPQSIIHEDAIEKPSPTPKITQIIPNITRTQFYQPARHHLDDTQMKKRIRQEKDSQQRQNTPKVQSKERERYINQNKRKQKSLSTKTRYIYDGPRIVYAPPFVQSITDSGHLLIKSERKNQQSYTNHRNHDAYKQYGTPHIVNENKVQIKTKKGRKNKDNRQQAGGSSKNKKLKTKMSQLTTLGEKHQPYFSFNPGLHQNYVRNQLHHTLTQHQTIYNQNNDHKTHKKHNKTNKKGVSIKLQCNISKSKIKSPFLMDWDPNTDSDFSGIDL